MLWGSTVVCKIFLSDNFNGSILSNLDRIKVRKLQQNGCKAPIKSSPRN
jgi:hypothetical protein